MKKAVPLSTTYTSKRVIHNSASTNVGVLQVFPVTPSTYFAKHLLSAMITFPLVQRLPAP